MESAGPGRPTVYKNMKSFWWMCRGKSCHPPNAATPEERARLRDICIVACQELDKFEGVDGPGALSDALLTFPRSVYEGQKFVRAIRGGELTVSAGEDPWFAVRGFLQALGALPQERWEKQRIRSEVLSALVGISLRPNGFQGRFKWHGREMLTRYHQEVEDAIKFRDRLAIICNFVDERAGRQPRADILNRPVSDYEREAFYVALQKEGLPAAAGAACGGDMRSRVYAFLEQHPPRPHTREGREDAESGDEDANSGSEREDGEAAEEKGEEEGEADAAEDTGGGQFGGGGPKKRRARARSEGSGFRRVVRFKGRFWRGNFTWRNKIFSSASSLDPAEAARCRDRAILCAQWLDEREGLPPAQRVPARQLNFDPSQFAKERFHVDLKAGKLEGYVAKEGDPRVAIRAFLHARGAYPRYQRKGTEEGQGGAESSGEEPDGGDSEEGTGSSEAGKDGESDSGEEESGEEAPQGSRVSSSARAAPAPAAGGGSFRGLRVDKPGFPGYFAWRDMQFSTPSVSGTAEEAARLRDRHIIVCQWLDERHKYSPALKDGTMNFPKSEYREERFYRALRAGELSAEECAGLDAPEAARRVREFLAGVGAAPAPRPPRKRSAGCGSGGEKGAPGPASDPAAASEADSDGDSEGGDEGDEIRRRWRELYGRGQRVVDSVVRLDGRYWAAFLLEERKAISPPCSALEDALRFIDRCRIAWFGPDGTARHGMETHYPPEDYTGEAWYRRLFAGPEAGRPAVGDNDPRWREDVAAAVRRTVAFVAAHGPGPLPSPPADAADPEAPPAKKPRGGPVSRPAGGPAAAGARASAAPPPAVPPAAAAAASEEPSGVDAAPDAARVLAWTPRDVAAWLAATFPHLAAPEHAPALRALGRTLFSGRALAMQPAARLRGPLLERLAEEAPGARAARDGLAAVLLALDDEVELLVEAARAGTEGRAREEIERLFAARCAKIRAAGDA